MKNTTKIHDILLGSKLILNYEKGGEVYSEKVKLVNKYAKDELPLRIEVGCIVGSFKDSELLEFENLEKERIILKKDDVIDYVLI